MSSLVNRLVAALLTFTTYNCKHNAADVVKKYREIKERIDRDV